VEAAPFAQLSREQQRRLTGYSAAGQQLLSGRIKASRDVLERAPDEHYTVELFVTENTEPARMERFLQRARDLVPLSSVFVIPMAAGGPYKLRVAYGDFGTREEAMAAGKRLPPKYQQAFRTVPRSFAELRSQI
jgi:septal ring-binding cell division protein DamX